MLLSLAVIVIIGIVAYFHYLQGLFSATISAVIALVAAVVAIGWQEAVVDMVNGGAYSDYATAGILVALFAVTYIVLRAIFDAAVPGNVRFPLMVDRAGAAVLGVFAGLLACGVLCIAAQSLKFGPTIAMFDMFARETRTVPVVPAGSFKPVDTEYETLSEPDKFISDDAAGLWVPADRLVLKLVDRLSDEGAALDAGKPFSAVHPDYLQELYGQRLSLQSGSRHTALTGSVAVSDIYSVDGKIGFPQDDNERWVKQGNGTGIRGPKASKAPAKLDPVAKAAPGKMFLVIRVTVQPVDVDSPKAGFVSFTPASARLVARDASDASRRAYKNYFPIGTLDSGILYRNEVDDALFVPGGKAADLVYEVPEADFSPDAKDPANRKLASDVFLEFKRFARVSLAGKPIKLGLVESKGLVEVVRKEGMPANVVGKVTNASLSIGQPQIGNNLGIQISVGTSNPEAKGTPEWGSFTLKNSKFMKVELNPVRSIKMLTQGQETAADLYVPNNRRVVMLPARPTKDPWKWASELGSYELVDDKGTRYKPNGVMAKLNNNGQDMLLLRYDSEKPDPPVTAETSMRPTDITLFFVVAKGTQLKSIDYKKELLSVAPLTVE